MASLIPKFVKEEIVIKWRDEDLWLMLLDEKHSPNALNQRYIADVVVNEITDTGGVYVPGGIHIVTGKSANFNGANSYLDLPDIDIGTHANLNYRYGILYTKTGGSSQATYKIRAQIDFLTNQIVTNGTSTIEWNALGIILVS